MTWQPITAVWPGRAYPRGATWDGEGVNFALFSEFATKVELCLFDSKGRREVQRIELKEQTDEVWHCYLPEARPGLLYGFRVYGPYKPEEGHRFNPEQAAARSVRQEHRRQPALERCAVRLQHRPSARGSVLRSP